MEYEFGDYYFSAHEEAELAMKIANDKWGSDAPFNGKIWSVKLEDETIVEMAEDGFSQFAAISHDNEYMVSREDPEWVCVT
jgi:hypothetical protein